MSLRKVSNRVVVALAVLALFSVGFITGIFAPPAEAAACSPGQTRWVFIGCCACNYETNRKLQACENGNWVDTGYSQCFNTGTCCRYPCCF